MTLYPVANSWHKPALDHGVLERYWCGEASASEAAEVEAWFARNPSERVWYEQLRRGLRAENGSILSRDAERARIQAILAAANAPGIALESEGQQTQQTQQTQKTQQAHQDRVHSRRPSYTRWYGMAAACALIALVVGWSANAHLTNSTLSTHASTYSTANGERATIRLPDGSRVVLNVGSRLTVPGTYTTGNRTVQLDGEALFIVEHEERHPFVVVAGPSITRVLGTSFVVRHYRDDSTVQVAVRDGKVAVANAIVTAAERVEVTASGAGVVHAIQGNPFSFERGVLSLAHMPLREAIGELNRWYDADIRLADESLGRAIVGGQFPAGSVLELTEQLTAGLDVQIERNGRVLTLDRRRK